MNRTDTADRVYRILSQASTVTKIRDALGVSHACAYQAIRRLEAKGKITKRRLDNGDLIWSRKEE